MSRATARRALRRLHTALRQNERVLALAEGVYDGASGLVAATERRLVFVTGGLLRGRLEEFRYGEIRSLRGKAGSLRINTGWNETATIGDIVPAGAPAEIGRDAELFGSSEESEPLGSARFIGGGLPLGDGLALPEVDDAEPGVGADDESDGGPSDEQLRLLSWRSERLRSAGFPELEASSLAGTEIDVAEACRLVGRGCPPDLVRRILL